MSVPVQGEEEGEGELKETGTRAVEDMSFGCRAAAGSDGGEVSEQLSQQQHAREVRERDAGSGIAKRKGAEDVP